MVGSKSKVNEKRMVESEKREVEIVKYSDAVYRGEVGIIKGKKVRHGIGVMLYTSGRCYEGIWVNDRREG